MKELILLTLLTTTLWSCSHTTEKGKETTNEEKVDLAISDFLEYIATLDQVPLPLKHNPLGDLLELSKDYDIRGFEKYKHSWTSKPLGIYYKDELTIGVIEFGIGDWGLVPFLTTYDLKGNKIDSTGFYKKSGQDMGYEAIEHLVFNSDRTIAVNDTVKRWEIDEEAMNIVEGSLVVTTGVIEYRILGNGQIEIREL